MKYESAFVAGANSCCVVKHIATGRVIAVCDIEDDSILISEALEFVLRVGYEGMRIIKSMPKD